MLEMQKPLMLRQTKQNHKMTIYKKDRNDMKINIDISYFIDQRGIILSFHSVYALLKSPLCLG